MTQFRKYIPSLSSNMILYVCLIYYIVMALFTPGFFSLNNTWNLFYNLLPLLIISIGQTLVMLTAGIDLSITAIVALTSVAGGYVMSADTGLFTNPVISIVAGIFIMVITGAIIGVFNGMAVAKFRMPAFMVTLTSLMIFSGLALWITRSQNIYNLPEAFVNFPYDSWLGIPIPVYLGVLAYLIAYIILNKTILGEWIYAVGVSPKTSSVSGVPVAMTLISVYLICGVYAALGSIFYTARLETGSPVMGQNILLDVIGAVVLGGTSLFGGIGKLHWTLVGAVFMTILDNSLNLMGLSFFLIMVVKGAIILVTAILNVWQTQKRKVYA